MFVSCLLTMPAPMANDCALPRLVALGSLLCGSLSTGVFALQGSKEALLRAEHRILDPFPAHR